MSVFDDQKTAFIEKVAQAFRAIGQPDIKDLIFVCESEGEFAQFDEILGIPVFKVPFLNVRGGLLLACREQGWTPTSYKLLKFQQEME